MIPSTPPTSDADPDQFELALLRLPRARDQLLPALLLVQRTHGCVPDWALQRVAAHLRLTASDVEGVASAYPDLRRVRGTAPGEPGAARVRVRVCTGASCLTLGAGSLRERLETVRAEMAAAEEGQAFELRECDCLFVCAVGPAVELRGQTLGRLDPDAAVRLVRRALDEERRSGSASEVVMP